ncbi:MAG: hypothetical protein CMQ40_02455 [Gammaproteobacteria bacterium]|nr:hypothetical protein [Gammaproteobacteria bacterium]|tara:strand:+ start:326 stop:976 length:651 start_codon:yes stop_codon:yes gene_type:complete
MSLKIGNKESTDNIWDAIYSQRAIRYWQEMPVSRDLIKQVVEAASKAPSGSNTQPWVFMVIDENPVKNRLADALREFYEKGQLRELVERGQETEDSSQRLMMSGAENFFMNLATAPVIVVPFLYQLTSPTNEPDSLIAGSSIYLAVQNLLLAARALGLGTLMTTAHTLIESVIRENCEIPEDAYPAALIPMGYPSVKFGPTKRKPVEDVLRWNKWG